MRQKYSLSLFLVIADTALINVSLLLAAHLRGILPFGVSGAIPIEMTTPPWYIYPVVTFCWLIALYNNRVYDFQHVLRWYVEAQTVLLGSVFCTGLLAGLLYFIARDFSRLQFAYLMALTTALLIAYRGALRVAYRILKIHRPGLRSRVLIVGAGELGEKIGRVILNYSRWGFDLVGFLDDNPVKMGQRILGTPVLGTIAEITEVISGKAIGEVWVTLPLRAYARLDEIVKKLERLPVKIYIVPDYSTHALVRSRAEVFAGLPVIGLREGVIDDSARMIKRIFDLVLTGLLMIPFLPVFGLIAIAIKLDSSGSVFFRQERLGENGVIFKMLKFRTMVAGAEEQQQNVNEILPDGTVIHKHADDPRVTKVGRFLRRYSLDELPQFFNVLKGEMSLVGPRPEMPWLVDKYEHWQRRRFAVPQGITGWWQINARSDKPMHLNTDDDLYYVYNYSLWLDIKILLRTPWAVLRGRGAF